MYLNKSILIGRITGKPELRVTTEGVKVTNLSLAVNETYKTSTGLKKQIVDFIDVTIFGKLAEVAAEWLVKGQFVMVEGKIKTRKWEKDGETRYRTFIQASNVQFGDKPKEGEEDDVRQPPVKAEGGKDNGAFDKAEYPTEDINPEDCPF